MNFKTPLWNYYLNIIIGTKLHYLGIFLLCREMSIDHIRLSAYLHTVWWCNIIASVHTTLWQHSFTKITNIYIASYSHLFVWEETLHCIHYQINSQKDSTFRNPLNPLNAQDINMSIILKQGKKVFVVKQLDINFHQLLLATA